MSWARLSKVPNNNNRTYNAPIPPKKIAVVGQPMVEVSSSKNRHTDIHTVILDSGAFIGRQSFFNNFSPDTQYYMTPAVNNEVRDKQSRQFMQNFPYQINVKKPDAQSMKYVSRFIQKYPTLKSLSRVDRQIIALAHTLEIQFEGNKNLILMENINNNKNKNNKKFNYAKSESGLSSKSRVKKSKSGRVHTMLKPMDDTGVRLASMKKVVTFNFDDFMTLDSIKYGEKYGKTTSTEDINKLIEHQQEKNNKKQMNQPNDPQKIINKDEIKSDLKNKTEKLNLTENKNESKSQSQSKSQSPPLSKAQKRRLRKQSHSKQPTTKAHSLKHEITNKSQSDIINDRHSVDGDINLDQIDRKSNTADDDDHNNKDDVIESAKSEIDKMIEHDLNTTFSETASLISSMSETNLMQLKKYQEIQAMNASLNNIQSVPMSQFGNKSSNIQFGTLFNGKTGSIFNNNPIQPIPQQKPLEIVEKSAKDKLNPNNNNNNDNESQLPPHQRRNANHAWEGEWLTPENYKPVAKNKNNKKPKIKNVSYSTNKTSSVVVITVDLAMQRCLIDMGLRVITTTKFRQLGNRNNNKNNNGEPIQFIFRCFGCFQFEHDTARVHCRWCGGQTFQRVAIYQDENGKQHYRYYYRDRFAYKYLEKHSLVPRGSQLIKNTGSNSNNHSNYQRNYAKKNKRIKNKKQGNRRYLGGGREKTTYNPRYSGNQQNNSGYNNY